MELTGKVVKGFGWHRHNMEPWEALPFKAYSGTLNVKVGTQQVTEFLDGVTGWIEHEGRFHPYRMGTLRGIPVAVTDSATKPAEVEVLAPIRLRDLPLRDGDEVTIVLDGEVE
jgi:CTP-dependent riboflavin kinase